MYGSIAILGTAPPQTGGGGGGGEACNYELTTRLEIALSIQKGLAWVIIIWHEFIFGLFCQIDDDS